MTFFIIFLLFILILLIVITLVKISKPDNKEIKKLENIIVMQNKVLQEQMSNNKVEADNRLSNMINSLDQKMVNNIQLTETTFKNVSDSLDKKLANQNDTSMNTIKNTIETLEGKLNDQNKNASTQVQEIIKRVTKLDGAQQQIMGLSESIISLEKVLNDKKARGTYGEIRLHQIFSAIFGENTREIYEEQFLLPNGKQVDFILHGPEPLGDLCIDSKFPLENYNNIINANDDNKLKEYRKLFKNDIKKHINDISDKYIIDGVTANQAMMFIPSESIFAEINAYHEDLIQYSYDKKIWITSPTTLMAILNVLIIVLKDLKRSEYSKQIHEALLSLKEEFDRYETRWINIVKHIETVNKDVKDISNTSKKISKRFEDIEKAEIKKEKQWII
ncbi:MAG: DNA recombination protein RmuC [Mycoplasmatales bacterium]